MKKKINLDVKVIGRGTEKRRLENYILKNNLNNIVKLVGFKNNPYPFIKQTEIFILTSKFEGLPNVLLEAISLNKFVISSNCSTGPNEILDCGKGGLLYPVGNYKELANKILFYSKNKILCERKLNFAKKRLNRFNYKKNLNLYSKIIEEKL